MTKRDQFIEWIGDAHAMEVGIVSTLEKHAADAKGSPKVKAALLKHVRETKRHAAEMEKALNSLGGSRPVMKEALSKVANLAAGLATSVARDTPVKNGIADFATEHFEIACYLSLIQTANALGETKIAATCEAILKEEQAMATTLEGLFEEVNAKYLSSLDDDERDGVKAAPRTKTAPRTKKVSKIKRS